MRFDDLLRAAPELYGKVQVIRVDCEAPQLNLDGTVDGVLVNANPRDTQDYPNGVWSLPPSFEAGHDYTPADARDRAKHAPIGESDRMMLKFVRLPLKTE